MMESNEKAPAVDSSEGQNDGTDHPEVYRNLQEAVNDGSLERIGKALDMVKTRSRCADCGEPSSVGIRVAYRKDEDAILCDVCYAQRRFEAMNRLERVTGDE